MDFAKNEHLNKNIRRIFLFKINITFGAGAAAAGASSVILSDFFLRSWENVVILSARSCSCDSQLQTGRQPRFIYSSGGPSRD